MKEYLRAFRQLAPIPDIKEDMPDDITVYTANCAFCEYCEALKRSGAAKNHGAAWKILSTHKQHLLKMNVLPIVIYSGANIVFVDTL